MMPSLHPSLHVDDVNFVPFEDGSANSSPSAGSPRVVANAPELGVVTAASVGALVVSVKGCNVALDVPDTMNWPTQVTTFRLEALTVHLSVDVAWPSGHREETGLPLMPQAGAQIPMGGPPEDGDHWTPMMITGEKTVEVLATESTTMNPKPSNNIMRAVCQHTWEQEVHDSDVENEDESHHTSHDMHSESFTVTGGKAGLAGSEAEKAAPPIVAIGFCFRMRLNVTATLYLSRVTGKDEPFHTLVINSTGTLELRPRTVELGNLRTSRIMTAAQEDAKRGDNYSALQKWRHVLPIKERLAKCTAGRENTKLASLLHSMGVSCNALGNGREALSYLRRALAIRQHAHGEEHPDSAKTLQAIGVVRVRDGEYHEAFEYFWQALRYYEAFEPDSLDAASTLQAVAGVYGKLGEYSEALECYLRAVSIRERELGKDNLEYATTQHNLGVVFEKLSEHTEALESLHQALAVRESKLGLSHPQTARTLHSIGIVYSQLLDYNAALTFYQRALNICEKLPGEGTHAAATLNNMGVVYAKLGNTQTAIEHHEHALRIQDKILGPNHADTVATRYNLHVLMMELEQNRNKGMLDHVKSFLTASSNCSSDGSLRKGKIAPSLLALLCEEPDEVDGPADEPCCCCECCRCNSTSRTLLHRGDGLPIITRDQQPPAPARLGFPQPRKRGGNYPAPPPDPQQSLSLQSRGKVSQQANVRSRWGTEDCGDCKDCKLSL